MREDFCCVSRVGISGDDQDDLLGSLASGELTSYGAGMSVGFARSNQIHPHAVLEGFAYYTSMARGDAVFGRVTRYGREAAGRCPSVPSCGTRELVRIKLTKIKMVLGYYDPKHSFVCDEWCVHSRKVPFNATT